MFQSTSTLQERARALAHTIGREPGDHRVEPFGSHAVSVASAFYDWHLFVVDVPDDMFNADRPATRRIQPARRGAATVVLPTSTRYPVLVRRTDRLNGDHGTWVVMAETIPPDHHASSLLRWHSGFSAVDQAVALVLRALESIQASPPQESADDEARALRAAIAGVGRRNANQVTVPKPIARLIAPCHARGFAATYRRIVEVARQW